MGEIAEMMTSGGMCPQCGQFINGGNGDGYERLCAGCAQEERDEADRRADADSFYDEPEPRSIRFRDMIMFGFSIIIAPTARMRHEVLMDQVRARMHQPLHRKIEAKRVSRVGLPRPKFRQFAESPWRQRAKLAEWNIEF